MKLQGTRKEKDPSRKKFEYSVNLTGFDLCDKELSYKIVGALSENMLVGSIKLTGRFQSTKLRVLRALRVSSTSVTSFACYIT